MKIDHYHIHEALDRTALLMHTFDDFVASSVFIESKPELKEQADAIVGSMYKLYKAIGQF